MFKYVWLNLNTGTFSQSWDEETERLNDIVNDGESYENYMILEGI